MAQVPTLSPAAESSLAWTDAYATALEAQTDLVVKGEPLTTTLTRIELAQWLAEFFEYIPDRNRATPIADLPTDTPDYWTAQAVLQAGAMRLYEGNQFRPNGNLTKLEALAILVRVLQLPAASQPEIDAWMALYDDAGEVPEIGRAFVAMAGKAGLLLNVPDPKRLTPNLVLRRGEGIALLHQTLVYRNQLQPFNPPLAQLSPANVPAPFTSAPPNTLAGDANATNRPQLSATRIEPESGTVLPGSTLTIEAQGTPGGQATVDIGPTIRNLPMSEVQPGLYRATYTASATDAWANPAISIQLSVNGVSTRVQRQLPQLIVGTGSAPLTPAPVFTDPNASASPAPIPVNPGPPLPTQPFPSQPLPAPAFPAATPAPNYPAFTAIRLEPNRNLQEGDILTISIQASSGALAQFDLGNLVFNQPMREVQTGIYEGTYVVAPTDKAVNPAVRIVVNKEGVGVQHQEVFPFTVDGSVGTRSTIQAPPATTNTGQLQILEISTNTSGQSLATNDILAVTMRGDSGGVATFRILNITPPIQMREISPGLYEGKVRIERNTPVVSNGVLEVALERNGQRVTRSNASPINIFP
jgi:hypothetical protein